jgi:MurNAc alpha-1-phosphate uridylyltransferase
MDRKKIAIPNSWGIEIMTIAAMPKIAMVMAAGFGTRMRPLTLKIPKPLVEVSGKALIDHTLDFLAASGIEEAVVNSHYLAHLLEEHLQNRKTPPRIIISREETLLETGGGIKKSLSLLGDSPFFSLNSDVICINGKQPILHRLWDAWNDGRMDALLLLHKVSEAIGYDGKGDFFLQDDGTLRRREQHETAPYVFTGLQIISPRLFNSSPDGAFSLNVLYNKNLSRIGAIINDGSWLHVGDIAGLQQAETWLANHLYI